MLQAYPTKSGTGITILGDYGDLASLYSTVQHVADTLKESNRYQKGQFQLLMNFCYEIRKAYSGQRDKEKITFDSGDEHSYYAFRVVWTDILIFISVLRHNAGYAQSDKFNQACMYLVEYFVEKALFEYDPEGANIIKEFIAQRINIRDQYAFLIYQAVHIKFVTEKPGKTANDNQLVNGFDGHTQAARKSRRKGVHHTQPGVQKEPGQGHDA
ncbi:MAG: hypothetical protein IAE95_11620 [Chitinophagaceae bacterium]|nr:hypothetical protein [Chitinophagaceae bacterium]